jgi:lipoprotein-releasing system permease protein
MQELYNLSNGVHGIAVRLNPGYDEEKVASIFREKILPPNELMTWLDMYAGLLWILKLEKNMQFFLLLFIVIVAAFAIANAQLLTVIRKTREIGLLGALGGQPHQLIACYCFQGLFIGVLGTIFGITIGLVALYFRNDIIYGFAKLTNSEDLLIKFYQFAELPVYYTCSDFLAISISALILTTLAALLPAWHAARMKPAEALRNE